MKLGLDNMIQVSNLDLGLQDCWQWHSFVVYAVLHSIWTLLPIVIHQRPFPTFLDALPFPREGKPQMD